MIELKDLHTVVRLLRNHLYPTYQLYAVMDNSKLTPIEGLKLGALTVLSRLRLRLGAEVPPALQTPEPEAYADFDVADLCSAHLNYGFVIDIISLPEKGMWTLQITEPDLGSDPGNPQQKRKPIAGRIIETNVAFLVKGDSLECGVQTVISDPENSPLADVYRPAFVKKLYNNPDFGLKQVVSLLPRYKSVNTLDKLKSMLQLCHNAKNQLPCVIFTKVPKMVEEGLPLEGLSLEDLSRDKTNAKFDECGNRLRPIVVEHELVDRLAPKNKQKQAKADGKKAFDEPQPLVAKSIEELRILARNPLACQRSQVLAKAKKQKLEYVLPPYNIKRVGASFCGFAHTFVVEPQLLPKLRELEGVELLDGDILIIEPQCFRGAKRVLPISEAEQNGSKVNKMLYTYPRGKSVDFGELYFLSGARDALVHSTEEAKAYSSKQAERCATEQSMRDVKWQAQVQEKNVEIAKLENQLHKYEQLVNMAERRLDEQQEQASRSKAMLERKLAEQDAYIQFLQQRVLRPRTKKELPTWAQNELSPHLLLHPRAITALEDASINADRLELIYDALEYLATDYWENRYGDLTEEELLNRTALKYQRGFTVTPNSDSSIAAFANQYKLPGYCTKGGAVVNRAMDYHLKAGNKTEHLVRIYFFFDDERQQIVVGYLPEHLDTVKF